MGAASCRVPLTPVASQVSVSKIKEKSKLSKFQTLEASDEL